MIATQEIPGVDPDLQAALLAGGLPVDDIEEPGRFSIASKARATSSASVASRFMAMMRCCAPSSFQRPAVAGYGRILTEAILRQIGENGGTRAFLLTSSAADFFAHLGFQVIDRAEAPTTILATRQASSICTSAALLTRAV